MGQTGMLHIQNPCSDLNITLGKGEVAIHVVF